MPAQKVRIITEFCFSPNRVVVLAMNVILLVSLAWFACSMSAF